MEPLDFEFLKDRYDFELQRREQLIAALALPVGVLGGLVSLLALMIRTFVFDRSPTTYLFVALIVLAVGSFFGCLIQLARAYHRQTYKFLPLLKTLDAKLAEWRMFYEDAGFRGAEQEFFMLGLRTDI